MGKKRLKFLIKTPKLPKWAWWVLWFVGILMSLYIILVGSFQVWVSTWQTYQNDEFGFSFRYPKNWHIGGTDITKKQFSEKGIVFFWVDSQSENIVRGETETKRSPGNVEIEIEKSSSTFEAHKKIYGVKIKQLLIEGEHAYTYGEVGRVTVSNTEDFYMASKLIDIQKNSYYYSVNTLTYSDNVYNPTKVKGYNLLSILKVKFYHLIGSTIVESFRFN